MLVLVAAAAPVLGQQQPPRFQSGVELLPIDVTVVDGRGNPIDNLAHGDFTVRVGDQTRRVVSAQWVPRLTALTPSPAGAPPAAAADGYFTNAAADGSGLVVIAIDESNIKFGAMRPMLPAVTRFIDRLPAADRIAIVSLGLGTKAWSDFTADRDAIKESSPDARPDCRDGHAVGLSRRHRRRPRLSPRRTGGIVGRDPPRVLDRPGPARRHRLPRGGPQEAERVAGSDAAERRPDDWRPREC